MIIPRRKQKIKYSRKLACKFLTPKGDISNSLQPLCFCPERDLVLGTRAYVCQVCIFYSQTNKKISEIYDESRERKSRKQIIRYRLYLAVNNWRFTKTFDLNTNLRIS